MINNFGSEKFYDNIYDNLNSDFKLKGPEGGLKIVVDDYPDKDKINIANRGYKTEHSNYDPKYDEIISRLERIEKLLQGFLPNPQEEKLTRIVPEMPYIYLTKELKLPYSYRLVDLDNNASILRYYRVDYKCYLNIRVMSNFIRATWEFHTDEQNMRSYHLNYKTAEQLIALINESDKCIINQFLLDQKLRSSQEEINKKNPNNLK